MYNLQQVTQIYAAKSAYLMRPDCVRVVRIFRLAVVWPSLPILMSFTILSLISIDTSIYDYTHSSTGSVYDQCGHYQSYFSCN